METNRKLETTVGIFLLAGFGIIAVLIVIFGRLGEKMGESYQITVEMKNASGLLKGASVLYAGAPIGRVLNPPRPIMEGRAVEVDLKLGKEARVRRDALFVIRDVGMLGDKIIEIEPQGDTEPYLEDGDRAKGSREKGFADLTNEAKPIMERIEKIVDRLDTQVFTPEAAADLRESIKKFHSVLDRTDDLLAQAQKGKGPLGRILNDPQAADDLSGFISNLRRHGVLFYDDDASKVKDKSPAAKK
jgi:phospholipid/cholesterol/gamma-HCH transport system substrate-binding protein